MNSAHFVQRHISIMLNINLELIWKYYAWCYHIIRNSMGLRLISFIIIDGSTSQLDSIINKNQYMVIVVWGKLPQEELSYAII